MHSKILVALDGSRTAEAVCPCSLSRKQVENPLGVDKGGGHRRVRREYSPEIARIFDGMTADELRLGQRLFPKHTEKLNGVEVGFNALKGRPAR